MCVCVCVCVCVCLLNTSAWVECDTRSNISQFTRFNFFPFCKLVSIPCICICVHSDMCAYMCVCVYVCVS